MDVIFYRILRRLPASLLFPTRLHFIVDFVTLCINANTGAAVGMAEGGNGRVFVTAGYQHGQQNGARYDGRQDKTATAPRKDGELAALSILFFLFDPIGHQRRAVQ